MNVSTQTLLLLLCLPLAGGAEYSRPDYEPLPTDVGQTWIEIDGDIYGARPNDLGPIGGGEGYQHIVTDGDYRVSTPDELIAALKQAKSGEVIYVEPGSHIDCSTLVFAEELVLEIPEGVTLAGNRGQEGSTGAMISSDAFATRPFIRTLWPNVRVTGLWIRGPDPKRRSDHADRSFRPERGDNKSQHEYYYRFPVSEGIYSKFSGLEVDNCQISGWSHAGVHLWDGHDHHVHHNYIHHNQMNGLGYGVCHGYGDEAVSLIEYNIFDANRHSIAGTGKPGNAYEAANNIELGVSLSHNFDMHGGSDRRDGTDIAGHWLKIHHNTFRGPTVRAIGIRGIPVDSADIYNNWFHHSAAGQLVILPWPTGGDTRVSSHNNAYGRQDPIVWDAAYQAHEYEKALDAGIDLYRQRDYTQARAHFSQALLLATRGTERSRAQLYIAHCHYKQGLFAVSRTQFRAIMNAREAFPDDRFAARKRLRQISEFAPTRAPRHWTLAFSDDFQRDELGDDWKIIAGDWRIEDGNLVCGTGHSEIVINKTFPGCQRIEFQAVTHAERPCDFSPIIHSAGKGTRRSDGGYLLQFGGAGNTLNRVLRADQLLDDRSADRFIEPGRLHTVVAELDGDTVRLTVDGDTIVEGHDPEPLIGPGHEIAGLYMYRETSIDNLKIYTSEPD
jgi:hypothetical protein